MFVLEMSCEDNSEILFVFPQCSLASCTNKHLSLLNSNEDLIECPGHVAEIKRKTYSFLREAFFSLYLSALAVDTIHSVA